MHDDPVLRKDQNFHKQAYDQLHLAYPKCHSDSLRL